MSFETNYPIRFSNLATASLRTELLRQHLTMQVKRGTGRLFPEIEDGQYFILCLMYPAANSWEIVRVTEKFEGPGDMPGQADTFRIVRAQEGTQAQYFPASV